MYLYIYSESVLSSKRVYFKIDNNKQCIIGRTTVLFIPFLNNKSPLVLRFLKKKKHSFCRINIFKALLGFFRKGSKGLLFQYL